MNKGDLGGRRTGGIRASVAVLMFLTVTSSRSWGQGEIVPRLVGGPCEGCEAVLEYGGAPILSIDTLPDFNDGGVKIKIAGTIYRADGRTPAPDVILYVYHTNGLGIYPVREGDTGWARVHGYIRGWVKTDSMGRYAFCTLRPGVYPSRSAAAHVHPVILEPDGRYYWLGSYLFEGDSLLTDEEKNPEYPRGGSPGVLTLKKEGDLWVGRRDFILGRNIPGYD